MKFTFNKMNYLKGLCRGQKLIAAINCLRQFLSLED